jgi:hypothetical protein
MLLVLAIPLAVLMVASESNPIIAVFSLSWGLLRIALSMLFFAVVAYPVVWIIQALDRRQLAKLEPEPHQDPPSPGPVP